MKWRNTGGGIVLEEESVWTIPAVTFYFKSGLFHQPVFAIFLLTHPEIVILLVPRYKYQYRFVYHDIKQDKIFPVGGRVAELKVNLLDIHNQHYQHPLGFMNANHVIHVERLRELLLSITLVPKLPFLLSFQTPYYLTNVDIMTLLSLAHASAVGAWQMKLVSPCCRHNRFDYAKFSVRI